MADWYYTPDRIEYWLEHWRELEQLATCSYPAGVPSAVPPGRYGYRLSDPLRFADVMADIERAWASLGWLSLDYKVVEAVMRGYLLREVERVYHLRHGTATEAYQCAIKRMARYLGWEGGEEQPNT